jgi:HrpA-like RNA helicase
MELHEKLKEYKERHKLWIIPLHSTITSDEQRAVFRQPVAGQRKVILSTNIAESSITVTDIKYGKFATEWGFCLLK